MYFFTANMCFRDTVSSLLRNVDRNSIVVNTSLSPDWRGTYHCLSPSKQGRLGTLKRSKAFCGDLWQYVALLDHNLTTSRPQVAVCGNLLYPRCYMHLWCRYSCQTLNTFKDLKGRASQCWVRFSVAAVMPQKFNLVDNFSKADLRCVWPCLLGIIVMVSVQRKE